MDQGREFMKLPIALAVFYLLATARAVMAITTPCDPAVLTSAS